jgi:hypothetical protein
VRLHAHLRYRVSDEWLHADDLVTAVPQLGGFLRVPVTIVSITTEEVWAVTSTGRIIGGDSSDFRVEVNIGGRPLPDD